MAFSAEIYKKAFEIKKEKRHAAQQSFENIKNELATANPRLGEIDLELGRLSAQAAISAMTGDVNTLSTLRERCEALNKEKQQLLGDIDLPKLQFSCPDCEDTGYKNGKICGCVEEIAKKLTFSELCKDMPIEQSRFDNFDLKFYPDKGDGVSPRKRMTQIFKICKEFSLSFSEDSQSLLLLGGTGLGKTHLSLAIAGEVIDRGHSVIYGSAQNLINRAAAEQFSYKGDTSVIDGLLGCDLLIIDDLGTEMSTSFSQSCIYNIINTRILRKLPTVISTNLSLDEIGKVYTPRISSRILGSYTLLQFLGNDIRQQKALANMKK